MAKKQPVKVTAKRDDPNEHWIVYTDSDGKRQRVTMDAYREGGH